MDAPVEACIACLLADFEAVVGESVELGDEFHEVLRAMAGIHRTGGNGDQIFVGEAPFRGAHRPQRHACGAGASVFDLGPAHRPSEGWHADFLYGAQVLVRGELIKADDSCLWEKISNIFNGLREQYRQLDHQYIELVRAALIGHEGVDIGPSSDDFDPRIGFTVVFQNQ